MNIERPCGNKVCASHFGKKIKLYIFLLQRKRKRSLSSRNKLILKKACNNIYFIWKCKARHYLLMLHMISF